MTALAAIFLLLAGSLIDSIAAAVLLRRLRRERETRREAWPPGRVVASRATIEETF